MRNNVYLVHLLQIAIKRMSSLPACTVAPFYPSILFVEQKPVIKPHRPHQKQNNKQKRIANMNIHEYKNVSTTGVQLLLWCSYLLVYKKNGRKSINKEFKQKECFHQLPNVACVNLLYDYITSLVLVFLSIHSSSVETVCLSLSTYS